MCCHDVRDDDQISVLTGTHLFNDIPIEYNVRYCNDRPGCLTLAELKVRRWERTGTTR